MDDENFQLVASQKKNSSTTDQGQQWSSAGCQITRGVQLDDVPSRNRQSFVRDRRHSGRRTWDFGGAVRLPRHEGVVQDAINCWKLRRDEVLTRIRADFNTIWQDQQRVSDGCIRHRIS
jgi:hypothetical protein